MSGMNPEHHIAPELRQVLLKKSDLRGFMALGATYLLIAVAMVLAVWPGPLQLLRGAMAVVLFGSAQIGLAVLMHECAHRSLFRRRSVNDWVGRWLCAEVLIQDLGLYRRYHLLHHKHTGTNRDPDAHITRAYPVPLKSMCRKVARDLLGITGLKTYAGIVAMKARYFRYQLNGRLQRDEKFLHAPWHSYFANAAKGLRGAALVYAIFIGVSIATGYWIVPLLWLIALFTSFQLMLRLRQIGDHGMVSDRNSENILVNTRTTDGLLIERLLLAPHQVHLHLEHHLMPGVPCYRLPALREALREQGILEQAEVAHSRSYLGLLRAAVRG
ncbi:MAG: fatty acid desaturase family protein [Pseudomonadota bacterium]